MVTDCHYVNFSQGLGPTNNYSQTGLNCLSKRELGGQGG